MSDPHWSRVDRLFGEVVELPAARRAHWLAQACGTDFALRAEIQSLLEHHENPQVVLAESALTRPFALDPESLLAGAHDPLLGKNIGSYRLEEQLGIGGMGAVYRATRQDGLVEHTVAIKLVRRSSPEFVRRFENECQALAKMSHANIARMLDTGITDEGTPFLVMEYVEGTPIDQYCDAVKANVTARIELLRTVASAVHYAHQNLVVHRDLKPANILVTADGVPKLLDFGIAKALDGSGASCETESQARLLTPDYASPEQVRGEPVTTATDIYSLGVVLYQLLTGRCPHYRTTTTWQPVAESGQTKKPSTAVLNVANGDSPKGKLSISNMAALRQTTPRRLCRSLRGDLDNIVMMALREDPQRRYLSAQQLREDLERHTLGLPVAARPDAIVYRVGKFLRRNRVVMLAAALVIIALAAGTVTTAWQAQLARDQRDAARLSERRANTEAEHARIEASSAQQMTEILIGSFLASGIERNEANRNILHGLLEAQVKRVRRQFAAKPHLRANLLDALGRVFASIHQAERAAALVTEASNVRKETFGTDSLEFALSLNSRGELAYQRGDFETAEQLLRRALSLHESLPVGVHTDVALMLNNLAVALRQLGELQDAAALHTRALAIRRAALGDGHLDVAESLNNLSAIHLARGEYQQAEALISEALTIRRHHLGDDDPLVTQTINNLASTVCAMRDYERGEALLREATARYRQQQAPDRLALARTLGNLAEVLIVLRKFNEARDVAEEALAINREHLGARHPGLASSLRVCAKVAHELGDFSTEQRHADEGIAILREVYGERHVSYAMAVGDKGTRLLDRNRQKDAEPLLRTAVAVLQASMESTHPHRVSYEISLGVCLLHLQQYDEAERLLASALECVGDNSAARQVVASSLERLRREAGRKASDHNR